MVLKMDPSERNLRQEGTPGFLTSYQIGSVSPMNGSESTAPDAFTCAAEAIYATSPIEIMGSACRRINYR
jgi:hypothetical protein